MPVEHAENVLVRCLVFLVLALIVVGCGEPPAVSSETTTSVTSQVGTGQSSTSTTASSEDTTTTSSTSTSSSSVSDVDFPEILLIDPDPTARESFDTDTVLRLRPPVFDLSTIARVHSYRTESMIDAREVLSVRTWSETAGLRTHVRVEVAPENELNPTEWIITPAGVWALMADEWVFHDPNEGESAFMVALAPWQLTAPLTVYTQVYNVFADLEPQRWEEFDGRQVVVYTGGVDVLAEYWREQPGDVVTGRMEVWMDPEGFPVKVTSEASEVRDASIPTRMEWLLHDLGAAIEVELPEQIAVAGDSTIFQGADDDVPILVVSDRGPCPAGEQADRDCSTWVLVYEDGRWSSGRPREDPERGQVAPSMVEPLLQALETADFVQLRTLLFEGECPTTTGGQETVLVFPTVTGPEAFASCTLIVDPQLSPYRETFELITELPLD